MREMSLCLWSLMMILLRTFSLLLNITILETTYLVNNLYFLSLDITMLCLTLFYKFLALYLREALALAPSA